MLKHLGVVYQIYITRSGVYTAKRKIMGTLHIRVVGGIVMWVFTGFKVPLKDCINNFTYSFVIGTATILILHS